MERPNAMRDTVHGWIKYSSAIKQIFNHPFMQRLRNCKQLGCADQVFPNAVHNRFSHSLGVMYISRKYMKHLVRTGPMEMINGNDLIRLAEMAGLLHDIGHGPFSHSFDHAVYSQLYSSDSNSHWPDGGHDIHRIKIVQDPEFAQLIEAAGVQVRDLIRVWTAKPTDGIYFVIKTVVGGPLGADRMDFIQRDALNCGTHHLGTIAAKRIIFGSRLVASSITDESLIGFREKATSTATSKLNFYTTSAAPSSEFDTKVECYPIVLPQRYYLCYADKCANDIFSALEGRRSMYHDIYFHKTAMAGSLLVERMLQEAQVELNLLSDVTDMNRFQLLDESTLIGRIMSLPDTSRAKSYYMRLRNRKWPKCISERVVYSNEPGFSDPSISEGSDNTIIVRSRPFTGVDPDKMKYYNIRFISKAGDFVPYANVFHNNACTPSPPYRIIRVFEDS